MKIRLQYVESICRERLIYSAKHSGSEPLSSMAELPGPLLTARRRMVIQPPPMSAAVAKRCRKMRISIEPLN